MVSRGKSGYNSCFQQRQIRAAFVLFLSLSLTAIMDSWIFADGTRLSQPVIFLADVLVVPPLLSGSPMKLISASLLLIWDLSCRTLLGSNSQDFAFIPIRHDLLFKAVKVAF